MDLVSARLRLEPLAPRHASALFDGLQAAALYEFIADVAPASVDTLRQRYARLALTHSPDGLERWLNWALYCEADGRYIGYVQATLDASRRAHIAYVLFPERWGNGYASEGVACMIEHLQRAYEPNEVRATVDIRNRRSIALLERLHF
jgi:ribosomal-protein-alanine N-acetyltransferase